MRKSSISIKVILLYSLLAIINMVVFVILIFQNQMDLIAENTTMKAKFFTQDVVSRLKKFSTEISTDGIFSAKNDEEKIRHLNTVLKPLIEQYAVFNEDGKVLYTSGQQVKLPETYITDGMKSISDRDFAGNEYNMIINDNKKEIYFYISLHSYNIEESILFIQFSLSSIDKELSYLYKLSLGILIIIFSFHVIFAVVLYRIIINPIKKLDKSSKEIAEGNYASRTSINRNDELGSLGLTFNTMAQSIQDKIFALHGDYFLNTLLLQPLGKNSAKSEHVDVRFFVEQKMKFQFRKWEKDVGGDICYSNTISLLDKNYIIFLNADAMGKSIQGAGGVIVLGAVVSAYVNRTKFTLNEKKQYPEIWIRNLYFELQRVFESFEGSMLMSAVFGLIDEETGFTYYINSEHPWTVLYRDQKASFLEKELLLRKLGIEYNEEPFQIRTMQLQKNDVLILGSDGRDDLELGRDSDNNRIINENEELFLDIVSQAESDLDRIVTQIKAAGELTDDLSLLRIEYTGNGVIHDKKLLSQIKENIEEITALLENSRENEARKLISETITTARSNIVNAKKLIIFLYNMKKYREAIDLATEYYAENPADLQVLLTLALSYKKTKNFNASFRLLEILTLREPKNLDYQLLFVKSLIRNKKFARAENVLNIIKDQDRDNSEITKLTSIISERTNKGS